MNQEWRKDAACWGVPIDVFIGSEEETWNPERMDVALKYCNVCPVKQECLQYALDNKINVGIYGGTSWRQRKLMKVSK